MAARNLIAPIRALILRSSRGLRLEGCSSAFWSILRDGRYRGLLMMRALLVLPAAFVATGECPPALAAEAWNIPHEKAAVLKGKVVDALCHLKGRCAPDCGGGKRQLGLVLADGTFRLVAKSNVDFAGAVQDLAGFCGREIEADGLLIENPAVTLFFVQGVRTDPALPFAPAERFKADWEARNGKAEEWWRADPQANRIIAEDGPFGRKDIKPK